MNIKLHTPKSLKLGSGMGSMKQFLLSLLATTVSIILTFGTAAIVDHNKKKNEKHEIVMMVMYDLYNSLKMVEKADSNILQSMKLQQQIAEDTTKFQSLRFQIPKYIPTADYTETTQQIISSNIETINTVGNVLFTEMVAEFYQLRKQYKTVVCDSLTNNIIKNSPFLNAGSTITFNYSWEALMSCNILADMRYLFAECKKLMDVSDEELEVYVKKRQQIDYGSSHKKAEADSAVNEIINLQESIDAAKQKLELQE